MLSSLTIFPKTSEEPTVVPSGGEKAKRVTFSPSRYLIAYKNLLRSIENIGIAVVYGIRYANRIGSKSYLIIRYYAQGNISQDQYIQVQVKCSPLENEMVNDQLTIGHLLSFVLNFLFF